MITQVVPLASISTATDPQFWVDQGWKGALGTLLLGGLLFAVYKGKIKFVVVGRNEKGARELFGIPVWPIFRAAHLHVDGVFAVRKAPTVPVPIVLRQNIWHDKVKLEYVATAFVRVSKQWEDLKRAIYSTLDTDKKDLENEMRDAQSRSILLGGTRTILSAHGDINQLTLDELNRLCAKELLDELGSELVKLVNEEFTPVGIHVLASPDGQAVQNDTATQAALAATGGVYAKPTLVPPPMADDVS